MKNYNDVLNQLVIHGLLVKNLIIDKLVRCKAEGSAGKESGWYYLFELPRTNAESILVGSYGIWVGDDNGLVKVELDKGDDLSKEEHAAIRVRIAENKKRLEFERKKKAKLAAERADSAWHKGTSEGHIDYFDKKSILAHGLRFDESGRAMVPMLDAVGMIHGLQLILDSKKHKDEIKKTGRNKNNWPMGMVKKGHFHLIGGSPVDVLLVAEGYATAATLYEATGLPVAVAFDANNLLPVGQALKKHYRRVKLLFCADDDAFSKCGHCQESVNVNDSIECLHCKKPHKKKNTGVKTASLAAVQLNGYQIAPVFSDEAARFEHYKKNKGKLTDFNDLQLTDGLHTVRTQIEMVISRFDLIRSVAQNAGKTKSGCGDNAPELTPISSVEEILERFTLIYGEGSIVFDRKFRMIIKTTDLADACISREVFKRWHESTNRRFVLMEEVGFDPTEKDSLITCNLFDKWPTVSKKGDCEMLLELLEYMCAECNDGGKTYQWILKWLAYPIQHHGAKMRSTIVIHGPQGTGKNLFFEVIMAIYGQYGKIIDQATIESDFTDWLSKKLFLIADEVVAMSEKRQIKNKLKVWITGNCVLINPKNKIVRHEKNHVNFVFLSNEDTPVVLENDDRRHAVIWTPKKLSSLTYSDIGEEINNGGVEALHDYLLNLPLGDFNEYTEPPMTQAKQDLIDLSKDHVLRFYDDWINEEIEHIPLIPVLSERIYELYLHWCKQQGVRFSSLNRVIHVFTKRENTYKKRCGYLNGTKNRQQRFIFPAGHQEKPPGMSLNIWLGNCVTQFDNMLEQYKTYT